MNKLKVDCKNVNKLVYIYMLSLFIKYDVGKVYDY